MEGRGARLAVRWSPGEALQLSPREATGVFSGEVAWASASFILLYPRVWGWVAPSDIWDIREGLHISFLWRVKKTPSVVQ